MRRRVGCLLLAVLLLTPLLAGCGAGSGEKSSEYQIVYDDKDIYALVNSRHIMNVVVMHNHPRNTPFSSQDINTFADYETIYMMTAICNDGKIHMLRKEEGFSSLNLKYYYELGVKQSEEAACKERNEKAKQKGIDINDPKNQEIINKISVTSYFYGIHNIGKYAKKIGVTYKCSVARTGGI